MVFLYIRLKVKNYEQWKVLFDANESTRLKHGIEMRKVFRSVAEPNEVSLLMEAETIEQAYEFFNSSILKSRMKKAGVIDDPEIQYLELA